MSIYDFLFTFHSMNQFISSLWENYSVLSLMGIWQGANRALEIIPWVHTLADGTEGGRK